MPEIHRHAEYRQAMMLDGQVRVRRAQCIMRGRTDLRCDFPFDEHELDLHESKLLILR